MHKTLPEERGGRTSGGEVEVRTRLWEEDTEQRDTYENGRQETCDNITSGFREWCRHDVSKISCLYCSGKLRNVDYRTFESVYDDSPRRLGIHSVQEQHDDAEEALSRLRVSWMDAFNFMRRELQSQAEFVGLVLRWQKLLHYLDGIVRCQNTVSSRRCCVHRKGPWLAHRRPQLTFIFGHNKQGRVNKGGACQPLCAHALEATDVAHQPKCSACLLHSFHSRENVNMLVSNNYIYYC